MMKQEKALILNWLENVIIGLDICPWAGPVYKRNALHLSLSNVASPERAISIFLHELELLFITPGRETTLLAFPQWVISFQLFWDVVTSWEEELKFLELDEHIQLVAFHPDFRFGNTPDDSLAHYVNRSPYPIVHFLRSGDVEKATNLNLKKAQLLSGRNEKKLQELTEKEWKTLFPWSNPYL